MASASSVLGLCREMLREAAPLALGLDPSLFLAVRCSLQCNVVSQHRKKRKKKKDLRPKGEFKNSSSSLGAPRRLFLTAISRKDVDGAGLI